MKTMINSIHTKQSSCEIRKTDEYGTKCWYNDKGELHRENDLPAVEYAGGSKVWYLNGKRHRETGPAYESANGYKSWYVDGERVDCEDNDTFLRMMKFKWCW